MTRTHLAGLAATAIATVLSCTTPSLAQNGNGNGNENGNGGGPGECQLIIEPGSSRWTIESYDPYSGMPAYGQFQIAWINQGQKQCIGDVTANLNGQPYGLRSESNPSADLLPYGLVNESNGTDITPYTGAWSGPFNGPPLNVDPGERVIQTYGFSVDTQDMGADGVFQQTVTFALRRRNSVIIDGQRDVTLAINVSPSAVMGLTGAYERQGGTARIDLGELSQGGNNDPVNLWVRATRAYRVTIQSRNQGRLMQGSGEWAVPYALSLGGVSIDLANPVPFPSQPGPGLRDDSYPFVVTVGQTAGQRAGRYSDLLTLTLAPI